MSAARNVQPGMTIQVGAFLNKPYAREKVGQLKKKGYAAYIQEVSDAQQRTWYMVRFGHFEKKKEAAASLRQFNQAEKTSAMLVLAK